MTSHQAVTAPFVDAIQDAMLPNAAPWRAVVEAGGLPVRIPPLSTFRGLPRPDRLPAPAIGIRPCLVHYDVVDLVRYDVSDVKVPLDGACVAAHAGAPRKGQP